MFKVIGHDQKEYGPISAEQVREWIKQGRLNGNSRAREEGATEWKPLAQLAPFMEDFKGTAGPPPMPLTVAPGLTPAPATSGMAIASLVLGILGIVSCGVTAIAGVILGPIALAKISRSNGQIGGRGIAIAGTIVSGLFLLFVPLSLAMFLPAFSKARAKAGGIQCMNHMKQLCLGVMMYGTDNKDAFPTRATWGDQLMPYISDPTVYQCPESKDGQRSHYAFNAKLDGVKTTEIKNPAQTVILFETSRGGWNLSGGQELLLRTPRHGNGVIVGFADGHVETVAPARLNSLNWDP